MSKHVYKALMFVLVLIFVTGCQDKPKTNLAPIRQEKAAKQLIEAVKSDSIHTEGMTKLDEFSTDLDMDSIEERIELYTAAGRDERGEMLWDDGQDWLLVVRDGENSYPLLSGFVQLGQIYYTVSREGAEGANSIMVIAPTGASLSLISYEFDNDKKCFVRQVMYESEEDNWIYSSIPGY